MNQDIEIELALRLAATPLEELQPSLIALLRAYYAHIPDIWQRFPDFLTRVMQFTGLALLESIQAKLHYYEPFGNTGVCMLQVAKMLLCYPEQSMPTVFGLTAAELMNLNHESSLNIERYPIPKTRKSAQIARSLSATNQLAQPFVPTGDSLLWDIVCNVQIQPDCSITHSRYKPLELPEETGDRFQQLPQELQRNYLRHQLRNYLYDIYFSGEQVPITSNADVTLQHLKNNTVRGVNLEFYEQLHNNNRGGGFFDPEMTFSTVIFQPILQQKTRRAMALETENQGVLVEIFKGALTLKTTTAAPQFWDEIQSRFGRLANLIFRTTQIGIVNNTFSGLVADIGSTVLLGLGSLLVINQELSIGQLLAFTSLNRNVRGLMDELVGFVDDYIRARTANARLQEVITATPETQNDSKKPFVPSTPMNFSHPLAAGQPWED